MLKYDPTRIGIHNISPCYLSADPYLDVIKERRQQETILDCFKRNFPSAKYEEKDCPVVCPIDLGDYIDGCADESIDMNCKKCWQQLSKEGPSKW